MMLATWGPGLFVPIISSQKVGGGACIRRAREEEIAASSNPGLG